MSVEALQTQLINPVYQQSIQGIFDSHDEGNLSFSSILDKLTATADATQQAAAVENLALLSGTADDVHSVVLAAEKADVTLSLTVAIRNKALDAYKEIMNMQV